MAVQKITVDEVKQRMDAGERVVFVDTRSPNAWAASDVAIPGSIRILADEIGDHLEGLPHDGTIVTYCT